MSYGAKKVFQNFHEAKEFAQALARDGAPHKVTQCDGQWQVEYHSTGQQTPRSMGEDECPTCNDLRGKISGLRGKNNLLEVDLRKVSLELETLSRRWHDLQHAHRELKDRHEKSKQKNSHAEVSRRIEEGIAAYRSHYEDLTAELHREKAQVNDKLRRASETPRMDLSEADNYKVLLEAYEASVGPFKFVTEKVTDGQKICARCGGDGGINQGCKPCEGRGLVDNVVYKKVIELI